jgi:two-component system, cell cycle sensor histidine kinase and response regulator CckA
MSAGAARGEPNDATRLAILEAFVDASHDAVFSLDPAQRIVIWNLSAERVFGCHPADVVGEPVIQLFPVHVRPDVQVVFEAVRGGDLVDHMETEAQRRDGMPVPISLSLRAVRDAAGTVQGFVGVARDLTEQRLAQAALAETAALLRDAETLAHAGRWLWDVASGAVQWSEEMHRIHGVDPVSFDGTLDAHLACVHDDDRAAVHGALVASVDSGRPLDVEYRIRRVDGTERSIHARAEPTFGSAGAVVGLRGFAHDVTERRGAADHALIGG